MKLSNKEKRRLEKLKKRKAQLTQQVDTLKQTSVNLTHTLEAFWKEFGLPKYPASYGDYLYGLIVRAELSRATFPNTKISEEDDQLMAEYVNKQLPGYNFSNPALASIVGDWRRSNFARVALGHKLASVLMLTSVPDDIEVVAPWSTWVLEVPDGMYPFNFSPSAFQAAIAANTEQWEAGPTKIGDELPGDIRAIFCQGVTPYQVLLEVGGHHSVFKLTDFPQLIQNYVKGVCLSFDERKHVKERHWARSVSQRLTEEPGYGRQYTLTNPVTIDFRDEVAALLKNPNAHVHTAQWLVRGHWRNQPCGVGRKERKRIRIDPHWKGPEEARILLRGYKIKEASSK